MEQKLVAFMETNEIDPVKTMERFMNNEAFFTRIIKKFPDDATFANLVSHMEEKNFPEAFKDAHTLKGVSANLGLGKLSTWAVPLTEELRNPPYDEAKVMALFQYTKAAYEAVLASISEL